MSRTIAPLSHSINSIVTSRRRWVGLIGLATPKAAPSDPDPDQSCRWVDLFRRPADRSRS